MTFFDDVIMLKSLN